MTQMEKLNQLREKTQQDGGKIEHRQYSYARLWDLFETDKIAMQARNIRASELRKEGCIVLCSNMPNQVKKYDGIGQPNGASCTVYCIDAYRASATGEIQS